MAPDADKNRNGGAKDYPKERLEMESGGLECTFHKVLVDFSYTEQPLRCQFKCEGEKMLTCNWDSGVFLTGHDPEDPESSTGLRSEFTLIPSQDDPSFEGSILIRNSQNGRYLCSSENGSVYTTDSFHEGTERWILKDCPPSTPLKGPTTTLFRERQVWIQSAISHRMLGFLGNTVHTRALTDDQEKDASSTSYQWTIQIASGELCFMSLPSQDRRLRCDMNGSLSMTPNWQGWEGWRFSPAGVDGNFVRITPWAHSSLYLSYNRQEETVTCSSSSPTTAGKPGNSMETLWKVQPFTADDNRPLGVLIQPAAMDSLQIPRVLRYDPSKEMFDTVDLPSAKESILSHPETSNCLWDLQSIHRRTYYIWTVDGKRRLEATKHKKRKPGTRSMPGRFLSEEWLIQEIDERLGVVGLYSMARQEYLASDLSGAVFFAENPNENVCAQWRIEEREEGYAIVSRTTQRVLVAATENQNKDSDVLFTAVPGTRVQGVTRWRLEPVIPRQVTKEKMQAVGTAVAIGVATTVATPLIIGGAVGLIGIAQVGVAGQVAIGSIRAAEAISSISRVTISSTELVSTPVTDPGAVVRTSTEETHKDTGEQSYLPCISKPFSAWRSW